MCSSFRPPNAQLEPREIDDETDSSARRLQAEVRRSTRIAIGFENASAQQDPKLVSVDPLFCNLPILHSENRDGAPRHRFAFHIEVAASRPKHSCSCRPVRDANHNTVTRLEDVMYFSRKLRIGRDVAFDNAANARHTLDDTLWPVDDTVGSKQAFEKPDLSPIQYVMEVAKDHLFSRRRCTGRLGLRKRGNQLTYKGKCQPDPYLGH